MRAILGELKDCMVVMDAVSPASVWTRDGLYAGAFNDDVGISKDLTGWEALAYRQKAHDDNQWGLATETSAGDVLWGQLRDNSTPLYRITGWDRWERQSSRLTLEKTANHARRNGTGLTGAYFSSPDLTGKPVATRVDPEICFGPMRGDHREVKIPGYRANAKEITKLPADAPLSIRWNGLVESPLSENFTFRVYTHGQKQSGAKVRARLGDEIADSWMALS